MKNGDDRESDDVGTGAANGDEPADAGTGTGDEDKLITVLTSGGDSEEIHRERFFT